MEAGLSQSAWPMRLQVKLRFSFSAVGRNVPASAASSGRHDLARRDDPAKTNQAYEIEAAEKARPLFRVTITSRDAR